MPYLVGYILVGLLLSAYFALSESRSGGEFSLSDAFTVTLLWPIALLMVVVLSPIFLIMRLIGRGS